MRLFLSLILLVTLTTFASAQTAEPEKPKDAEPAENTGKAVRVFTVDKVTVRTEATAPEKLVIEASGTVRTGGWTEPMLQLRKHQTRDGTLTIDFLAIPPDGMATQAITPIQASLTIDKPGLFRGVIVRGETNAQRAK